MKLIIVTGAGGKLGEQYLKSFSKRKGFECLAIIRNTPKSLIDQVEYKFADLLDLGSLTKALSGIKTERYNEIIFIHPVGMFKFEEYGVPKIDSDKDGIDDEIFKSNVTTFLNVFNILKRKVKRSKVKTKLTLFAFGSITHNYNIPFWQSYTKSKQVLKDVIKKDIKRKSFPLKCIFVNVSTVDTGNERNLRPHAKRKYWLSTEEIARISLDCLNERVNNWTEISIYKSHPEFDPTWYTNHENVLKRWQEQMGRELT